MKPKNQRRNFLKGSILAAAGTLLFNSKPKAGIAVNAVNGASTYLMNDTLEVIKDLHTTHGNFQDTTIPDSEIELIKKASVQAANSSNMQTYSVIVIKEKRLIKEISTYNGSAVLLFCIDYNRIITTANSLGHEYHPDNMTNFVTASINTSFAAQTAVIAAKSLGIDTLTTNGIHRGDMQRLWDKLDLPKEKCFPLIAVVMGYATEVAPYHKGRLEDLGIFHDEKYHKLNTEETQQLVEAYDDPEKHLGLNETWKKDGHKHYLDWLHSHWLRGQREPSKEISTLFKFIKRSGFSEGF